MRHVFAVILASVLAISLAQGSAAAAPPAPPKPPAPFQLPAPPAAAPVGTSPWAGPTAAHKDGPWRAPTPEEWQPVEPAPPHDAFYNVPPNLASLTPGSIIRSRPVHVNAMQIFPISVQAWQLLYRTTGQHGEPDAAVTTIMIPKGHVKNRPLLSYQQAADSTLRICNASYGLIHGFPIEPANPAGPVTLPLAAAEVTFAAAGLAKGWAVNMPDHGSVNNRFLTPRAPGYAVLDSIRAVERFQPVGLNAQTPVALWGYSGGAIASSWAAEMQPGYAPELNIKGVAFGAVERDLEASVRAVSGTPLGGLIPLGLASIAKDSPEVDRAIRKHLTKYGFHAVFETRRHCAAQNVLSNLWFRYDRALNKPLDDVLADPPIRKAIDERNWSGKAPTAPVYVYNGTSEEVAPIVGTDPLVKGYCAGGTPVTYKREVFPPRPLPQIMTTHGIVVLTGAPAAFAWIKHRLEPGAQTPSGCHVDTTPSSLLEPQALQVAPLQVGSIFEMLVGAPLGAGR